MKQFFSLFLFSFLVSCTATKTKKHINMVAPLSVSGTKIINSKAESVSLMGNSLFWSNSGWSGHNFYNPSVVKWLHDDWKSLIIRCAVAADVDIPGGYYQDKQANLDRVSVVVDACIANGMYVIIDWHSHNAYQQEDEAISFFQMMATKYGKYPNVIYEIYNEPLRVSWDELIKPYAVKVIAAIRKIDPDNLIVVGTPNWSQDVDVASKNPITEYKNIAYTLHFYAASHKEGLRNKAQVAINNGLPIFVTEWGTVKANGNGGVDAQSVSEWMLFMKKNKISACNWAINDKEEGASVIQKGASKNGGWSEDELTPSGKLVRDIIRNWNL